jgi:hypothetical protein
MPRKGVIALIVLLPLAFMLVLGNSIMPAQAGKAVNIIATPTETPMIEPQDTGESVPGQQQEEIKIVIQSYFDVRYRARNAQNPDDFRLTIFGDMISGGDDAKVFERAEIAKMAIVMKHERINRLRLVNYQFALNFIDFSLDPASQIVTVSVVETSEYITETAIEHSPNHPILSKAGDIKHVIRMRLEQRGWKIVSDYYSDMLWRQLRTSKLSAEQILASVRQIPLPPPPSRRSEAEGSTLLPPDDSWHPYNRADAALYAAQYYNSFNPNYPNWDGKQNGGDCMNFVSQALYEGGDITMAIPDVLPDPSTGGQLGWYVFNDLQHASAWNHVDFFYDQLINGGDPGWLEGPQGVEVPSAYDLDIGDVIQFEWNDDTDQEWDHAMIVTGLDDTHFPYVTGHSDPIYDVDYRTWTNIESVRFLHVERSNGQPPIKSEIHVDNVAFATDDGGEVPLESCTYQETDPEVYFGKHFNGCEVTSGFRFTNLAIPQGATIRYAYIDFLVDGPYDQSWPIHLKIQGENTANALTFSPASPPSSRIFSLTGAYALWDPSETWILADRHPSPDLKNILQEIVTRADWSSGNAASFIFMRNVEYPVNPGEYSVRRVLAYERASFNQRAAARLVAAYDIGGDLPAPETYTSVGAYDGWILESREDSYTGGSINSTEQTFTLGDDSRDRQYLSILSFDTSVLPDNAVIVSAKLIIYLNYQTGDLFSDPNGHFRADMYSPYFGNQVNLQKSDFQAPNEFWDVVDVVADPYYPSVYSGDLVPASLSYIDRTSTTQFRLRFTARDDDDMTADITKFYSGDSPNSALWPQLIVTYYVPGTPAP